MRCIRPIKATQDRDGDVVYTSRLGAPGLVGFELPCRKCLPCRIAIGREKAIRCWHESKCHEDNIFLTLTYDDDHCPNGLEYSHFQKFMKDLRERLSRDVRCKDESYISFMVTGEFGEKTKRPHWHAILFNYKPEDAVSSYATEMGEEVFTSKFVDELWGRGFCNFGSVTMDSASYVARYAAKKLVHGKDDEHEFHPVHKTSKGRPIGRSWIEKNWRFTFENGFVVLPNGEKASIPRYYCDWFKRTHPVEYGVYVSTVRHEMCLRAEASARKEELEFLSSIMSYLPEGGYPFRRVDVKERILKSKFKRLQERLRL